MKDLVIYITLAVCLTATACGGRGKEAASELEHARGLYERNEWLAAKNTIDTIRARYPSETVTLREALVLMRRIEMKETERNIAYCDSLLPIRQAEAAIAVKGFVFEKDSAYEEKGAYVRPQQTVERNIERSYVRCGVNEDGEMYIASVYFGSSPIRHTGIKVSLRDGIFVETASIPYDVGLNYRFQDGSNTSEIIQYKGEHGADAIKFICNNAHERLRVDYTGGAQYSLYMSEADKQSLVSTYWLASILSDIHRLASERTKALKRKDYLEAKLTKSV
ncbi:MAG: hypothetical protein LBK65_10320 [Tannerellaceae bacterium]|nr:hypothetical protein [Tannerellaceae bacterium]